MLKRKYFYTKKYRDLKNYTYVSSSSSSSSSLQNLSNNNAQTESASGSHVQEDCNNTLMRHEEQSAQILSSSSAISYNENINVFDSEISCSSFSSNQEIECCNNEEVEKQSENLELSFKQKILDWSVKNIAYLNNKMLSELLCILKTEHNEFPKSATTFLQTKNSKNVVQPMLSANGSFGSYIYFGLKNALKLMINPKVYKKDVIKILVNIDGVQIYKNSKQQFWPILIMLHDKKYIVKPQVVAIYHGKSKPKSPTEFLNDFIEELSNLITNKIKLKDKIYNIKLLAFVCDTPARAFIKCVKSHVAFYACERCIVKGKTIGKNKRIYARTTCEERNKHSFEDRKQHEHHLDNEISPLLKIPGFDPVKSVVLDSMHLLFLGVTKTLLTNIVFGGPKVNGIGPRNRLLLCDLLRSLSGQIPTEFQRKVFDITDLKNWKATQFRFFLLYSGILVLRHVLPNDKYKHFCLLYVACRLLCSNDLAVLNAENAKKLLILFFRLLPKFYGSEIQSINFHNLIHVADDVTHMTCSLTSISAFPFENFLMTLKKLVRTPKDPLSQVANRLREINLNTNTKINRIISLTNCVPEKSNNLGNNMTKRIFTSIIWNGIMIANTFPNNVVQFKNNEIVQIEKIYSLQDDDDDALNLNQEKIKIKGLLYYNIKNVFKYPHKSSEVGLWQVALSKNRRTFCVQEIKHKCVLLNIKNISYCTQLLHT